MKLVQRIECPFCKKINFKSQFKQNYSHPYLKSFISKYYQSSKLDQMLKNEIYEISECLNCRGLFQKFIPDLNFSNYLYDDLISATDSLKKKSDYLEKNKKKLNDDFEIISNLFRKKKSDIKILEFGSGWGFWSKFMKSKTFNITTCEFSEKRHNHLIHNNISNFKNLADIKDKFDFIYSEEVLEHVSSPLDILLQLKKLLSDDGFMLHRFPSTFLFKKKIKSNYLPQKDCGHPLEHINMLNKKSFLKMCQIANLNIHHPLKIKKQKFTSKIKLLKNYLIFNFVILKKNINY